MWILHYKRATLKATMGRELMAPRTDRTTRVPPGVASPVTALFLSSLSLASAHARSCFRVQRLRGLALGISGLASGRSTRIRTNFMPASRAVMLYPAFGGEKDIRSDLIPLYSPLYGGVQCQGRVQPLLSLSLSLASLSLSLSLSPLSLYTLDPSFGFRA